MKIKATKTGLILTAIFILALVLRITAASHVSIGPDELIYSVIPIDIISADRLSTVEQSPLYFYLKDIGYKLLGGVTPISTRFPSIIFGSFAVFLIFLISRELFKDKNAGLISSFLFAVSGFAVRYNYETDMTAFFFALLSVLFFLYALKGSHKNLYFASLFLAIGVLAKNIILLFAPAFLIVWLVYGYKNKTVFTKSENGSIGINKKAVKTIFMSALIFLVVVSPVLIYNYLVYLEKGITDYYFSVILGIGETVHVGLEGADWSLGLMAAIIKKKLGQFLRFDIILAVIGIIGAFFAYRKNKYGTSLLLLTLFFFGGYMLGTTGSNSHYLWLPIIFSIFGGYLILTLSHKYKIRNFVLIVLAIIFIANLFMLKDALTYKSSILALREYVHEDIPDNAVVIIDPRVYRGIYGWVFNDKHYLEGTHFPKLNEDITNLDAPKDTVPFYYIECGKGTTCLWSNEDYDRISEFSEQLTDALKQSTTQVATITGNDLDPGNRHTFIVHSGSYAIPSSAIESIDRTHVFYFYPIRWKFPDQAVDTYTAKGFGKLLNGIGFLILYINVLIAILALPYTIYLLRKKEA